MTSDVELPQELVTQLQATENYYEKIKIIEGALLITKLSHAQRATARERLADYYLKTGRLKGEHYEKAAADWEMAATLANEENPEITSFRRQALRSAVADYQKASRMFQQSSAHAHAEEVTHKASKIKAELLHYPSPLKATTVAATTFSFLLSLFFLSSNFTGFVVAPLEPAQTTVAGFVLFFMGLLGLFLLVRWA